MRFAIDAVFLDRDLRVLDVAAGARPWRMAGRRGARAVLELPAGEAARRRPDARYPVAAGRRGPSVRPVSSESGQVAATAPQPASFARASPIGQAGRGRHPGGCRGRGLWSHARRVSSPPSSSGYSVYSRRSTSSGICCRTRSCCRRPRSCYSPRSPSSPIRPSSGRWPRSVPSAALLILALIRPGGIGMGDVKLGLLLGAGLGVQVVGAVTLGFIAIRPVALWLAPSPRLRRHSSVPCRSVRRSPSAPLW